MNTKSIRIGLVLVLLMSLYSKVEAQKKNDFNNLGLTHYFNDDHSGFISLSGYAELWARYTQHNPGTFINNQAVSDASDLSLRRVRVKMTYKPTEKLMFVLQGGTTNVNVNVNAKRSNYFDLLDAYA